MHELVGHRAHKVLTFCALCPFRWRSEHFQVPGLESGRVVLECATHSFCWVSARVGVGFSFFSILSTSVDRRPSYIEIYMVVFVKSFPTINPPVCPSGHSAVCVYAWVHLPRKKKKNYALKFM